MKQFSEGSLQLHDIEGQRKYLTAGERKKFLEAAAGSDRKTRTLCLCLAYTGCRLSEALELTADRIDLVEKIIIFRSLKKPREVRHRAVPAPYEALQALDLVHGIRERQKGKGARRNQRLWRFSRTTAWRRVSSVMKSAGIVGPQASPKGLRHGFGIAAIQAGVPLNLIQKWLGHAHLSTTAVYADAVGAEEREIARKMWENN